MEWGGGFGARGRLRAELITLLAAGATDFQALYDEAVQRLGARSGLTLHIACKQQQVASWTRPVRGSVAAWGGLLRTTNRALDPADPVRMEVVSRYGRWLGRRGLPGDLDIAVRYHTKELRRRVAMRATPHWIGVARMDLAWALVERARLGRFDPVAEPPADGEALLLALELATDEVTRRTAEFGPDDLGTWPACEVRAAALITAACARSAQAPIDGDVEEALRAIEPFAAGRAVNGESRLLRARLLQAEALLLLGHQQAAEQVARLALALHEARPGRWRGGIDPGRPWLTWARTLAPAGRADARAAAAKALEARESWFPEDSVYLAEVHETLAPLVAPELEVRQG
ncbi:hypothetical protein J5X84_31565 [Streptosporangiaceae bacterium NEAU-GS5]|nr:hypothetical protein [Streptosporangiaceae bacterium NEAU-GS5]